jgi:hypothetical protein
MIHHVYRIVHAFDWKEKILKLATITTITKCNINEVSMHQGHIGSWAQRGWPYPQHLAHLNLIKCCDEEV